MTPSRIIGRMLTAPSKQHIQLPTGEPPWRGISIGRDLFLNVVVLGFVTIAIARFRVTDWLKSVASELRILKGRTNA